jgi:transcriptional regulator GlxA family with amidase domain
MERQRVGIFIFPEVEVLDFCGPFEVFSVTRLKEERRREEPSPFEPLLVAANLQPVRATGGLRVLPDHDLESCPPLDVLLIPGGWGTRAQVLDAALLEWVRGRAATTPTVASVCTGSFVLAQAGLLDGRRATTHWRSLDRMRDTYPRITVEYGLHVVKDGNIFTSAGIAAGIDLALRLVARGHGETVARATARYMEYGYPKGNARRIALD